MVGQSSDPWRPHPSRMQQDAERACAFNLMIVMLIYWSKNRKGFKRSVGIVPRGRHPQQVLTPGARPRGWAGGDGVHPGYQLPREKAAADCSQAFPH